MVWLLVLLVSATLIERAVPHREADKHQVIIVGAGVSGFTAAATLLEHNVTDLVILEASDRIGGRIHTVEFGDVSLHMGAEYVHGEVDNSVYEMISPHHFVAPFWSLQDFETSFKFVNTSGDEFNSTVVGHLVDDLFHIYHEEGVKHFNGSLGDYFTKRLNEKLGSHNITSQMRESLHHLVSLMEEEDTADDLSQVGAWGFSEYTLCGGEDNNLVWLNETFSIIFDFLSKKFPNPADELPVRNKTLFGKQVTRVERKEEYVEVTCGDGSSYVANHVIVTPSLGVLKKHAATWFHPALPADKTDAIEALGFGCVTKLFLLFPTRWWPNVTSGIAPFFTQKEVEDFKNNSTYGSWSTETTGFFAVVNHERMLCVWYSGQQCRTVETLTDEEVTDGLMELLNKLVGKHFNIPKPESILRSKWLSDPYTLGTYSFRTVTSDQRNLTNTILSQPVLDTNGKPVLMFAGEATHPHYYSTVHGALDSGRREANRLLDYLATQKQ